MHMHHLYVIYILFMCHLHFIYISFIFFLQTDTFVLTKDELHKLSIISFLNKHDKEIKTHLSAIIYFVKIQTSKRYSSIDSLKDIQDIPLYVCHLCIIYVSFMYHLYIIYVYFM